MITHIRIFLFSFLVIVFAGSAASMTDISVQDLNEAQKNQAETLFKRIKCPVCGGQPLAESDLEISQNLRNYIVKEVLAGKSNAQIEQSLVNAYGESILLKPRLDEFTLALWLVPGLLCLFAIYLIRRVYVASERLEEA